jgi:prepilin-type N-terminal cleavage/methylation domain-containing protein
MKNFLSKQTQKGFTLIELIVVVAIIAVISALSLFNSSKLNSSVLLSNTAYEVGLIIRDAQVAGLGAKVISGNVGGTTVATTSNQGIYFDIKKPEQVVFFADLNRNNTYDEQSEQSQIFKIENKRAGKILNICKTTNNTLDCNVENVNIIFKRPNPEAYFYPSDLLDKSGQGHIGNIVINMGFTDGECKSIIVYKTGAIQIDKTYCPPITN